MPRSPKKRHPFANVSRQAASALDLLQVEIRRTEAEIDRLLSPKR